jgi:hypothetical protein
MYVSGAQTNVKSQAMRSFGELPVGILSEKVFDKRRM